MFLHFQFYVVGLVFFFHSEFYYYSHAGRKLTWNEEKEVLKDSKLNFFGLFKFLNQEKDVRSNEKEQGGK